MSHSTIQPVPHFGTITNEFETGRIISNTYGTIAMAKTADPHSATSQWFFNLADNHGLNDTGNSGGFTVFGRVISGWGTLEYFNDTNRYHVVQWGPFTDLPVHATNEPLTVGDLFPVGIEMVAITNMMMHADGTITLQWPNASGLPNIVQAASCPFDGAWGDIGVVGTAEPSAVFTHANAPSAAIFYRVVVRPDD